LATLTGRPIAEFSVATADTTHQLPPPPLISPGLPADILARRPDLAESAQNIHAQLAMREIAKTAFFPSIRLTSDFGYSSKALKDLLKTDSQEFTWGPIAISLPILDGGRNRANLAAAEAHYQEAIAVYRSQLLIALREVDDALTDIQSYEEQVRIRHQSLDAARRAVLVSKLRYEKGVANYLQVADSERSALTVEREALLSRTQALIASVQLVRALGGGWSTAEDTVTK
jgi:multidrug efflux system outer membrane protein